MKSSTHFQHRAFPAADQDSEFFVARGAPRKNHLSITGANGPPQKYSQMRIFPTARRHRVFRPRGN
jgi:hypothetical protein